MDAHNAGGESPYWRPDLETHSRAAWEDMKLDLLRQHLDEAYRGSPY